ncbi:MAG: helix-turn-helix transcriptional regulator [Lachnospiraceae bacterium]|jgi:transcriptional regulator with XRE-family HTH domain|nr:helix-turn-helix transcriptional regulator [Lachnospiraceae bacterium]MCR5466387.1 helix-turn-helix domain-containing protein [Lachnospiraceae bacterium]
MREYVWETPSEIDLALAKRLKGIRKRRKLTQEELAVRANVSYGSLKKFERTGDISLRSLTRIALELGVCDEIRRLFTDAPYGSIEEILNERQ